VFWIYGAFSSPRPQSPIGVLCTFIAQKSFSGNIKERANFTKSLLAETKIKKKRSLTLAAQKISGKKSTSENFRYKAFFLFLLFLNIKGHFLALLEHQFC